MILSSFAEDQRCWALLELREFGSSKLNVSIFIMQKQSRMRSRNC